MKEQANTCSKHLQIMPFGKFIFMLEYKADMYNSTVVKIDKYYPSTKTCSCCGSIKIMTLEDRTYNCEKCGMIMDRDLNAALNIKNEGKRILSTVVATECGGKSQVWIQKQKSKKRTL